MTTIDLGSFNGIAIAINKENLDDVDVLVTPSDQREEIEWAIASGTETEVYYANYNGTHYLFFPNVGRGAVCTNGDSDWTFCDSLDDLEHRWVHSEQWCN